MRPIRTWDCNFFLKLGDLRFPPEAGILRRNKTPTHSHDRKQPNLPKVRALSYTCRRPVPEK